MSIERKVAFLLNVLAFMFAVWMNSLPGALMALSGMLIVWPDR